MNRVAHERCPNCHLAGWVKLTSYIAKYQTRFANTLNTTQEVLVCLSNVGQTNTFRA